MDSFRVVTYNLFKGRHWWSGHSGLQKMGDAIKVLRPELLFLQELRGPHPGVPDFRRGLGLEYESYGRNFVGKNTDHGNAIYSSYPIEPLENRDISIRKFEKRGLLSAKCILGPDPESSLFLFCTHLDLGEASRARQLAMITEQIEAALPNAHTPFVLAGDFNDWNLRGDAYLRDRLSVREAHFDVHGSVGTTFPSVRPIVRLDRIYYRGLKLRDAKVVRGPFQYLSDHLPIVVDFEKIGTKPRSSGP